MTRLGIAVQDLGASELAWRLIRQANERVDVDVTFFVEDPLPPCSAVGAAIMRPSELWGYTGPVVATTLSSARRLAGCPGPSAKTFYCWDLEWLRVSPKPFLALRAIYADPRLPLVARTPDHARLLKTLWGGNVVGVVPRAELNLLLGMSSGQ